MELIWEKAMFGLMSSEDDFESEEDLDDLEDLDEDWDEDN